MMGKTADGMSNPEYLAHRYPILSHLKTYDNPGGKAH